LNDPTQAKLFVEQCVSGMHDVNPSFGHLKVDGGGHSLHSVDFKSGDGTTAEQIQIINDSGAITWTWVNRSKDLLTKWYYPA